MFISDLDITTPTSNNPLTNGDNELRNIKLAIKDTFKNFVSSQLNYSPIELTGLSKFINANASDLLWVGSVPGKDNVYVIAVTENKILYARTPKTMWGTIIYSQFNQTEMNIFYPNVYRLLDGKPITGTLLNKILLTPILDSTDLKNLPNMTNVYARGIGAGNLLLQPLDESVKIENAQLAFSYQVKDAVVGNYEHSHVNNDNAYFNESGAIISYGYNLDGGPAHELDYTGTHINPSVIKDIHAHNFAAGTSTTNIITPTESSELTTTGAKKVIRPQTHNLYAYTRVN